MAKSSSNSINSSLSCSSTFSYSTQPSTSDSLITMTVMLFDQHPDGPYMDLIQRAFSPSSSRPVIRQDHYKGKKVRHSCYTVECFSAFVLECGTFPERKEQWILILVIVAVVYLPILCFLSFCLGQSKILFYSYRPIWPYLSYESVTHLVILTYSR